VTDGESYGQAFYDRTGGGSARSAAAIVPILLDLAAPQSVVDVGCGKGAWLQEFHRRGVTDLTGLDGAWAAPASGAPYTFLDRDLSSAFTLPRTFDLAVSLEVAEHLPPGAAPAFVESLVRLAPVVVFSAAIPCQGGVDHANEQWPDFWARHFASHAYRPIDSVRPRVWNDPTIEWWYAQNTIVYASEAALDRSARLREAAGATDASRLSLVHPRAYLHQVALTHDAAIHPDPDRLPASTLLGLAPRVLLNAIKRRL
jgi:SAM-dependent methyltransferase